MSRKVSVPSVPSLAAALLLTAAVAVATSGRAYGQCRLYRVAVSATWPAGPSGPDDPVCATASCNGHDLLVSCSLGPHTTVKDSGGYFRRNLGAYRKDDTTCEACGEGCSDLECPTNPEVCTCITPAIVEAEATCIATQ
jgi:hypothetical protein